MKHVTRLILFIFLAFTVALALPNSAQAADAADDKVVFGDTYTLASGQTLNGNLAVLGGTATLEAGSTVNGDVALMGGTLEISGTVSGNVSTLGGTLFLDDGAVIEKDVTMMGGTLHRSENAQIRGSLVNGGFHPFQFNLPNLPINWRFSNGFPWTPIWNFFSTLFSTLVVAALAVLVVLLWPRPTERVGVGGGSPASRHRRDRPADRHRSTSHVDLADDHHHHDPAQPAGFARPGPGAALRLDRGRAGDRQPHRRPVQTAVEPGPDRRPGHPGDRPGLQRGRLGPLRRLADPVPCSHGRAGRCGSDPLRHAAISFNTLPCPDLCRPGCPSNHASPASHRPAGRSRTERGCAG